MLGSSAGCSPPAHPERLAGWLAGQFCPDIARWPGSPPEPERPDRAGFSVRRRTARLMAFCHCLRSSHSLGLLLIWPPTSCRNRTENAPSSPHSMKEIWSRVRGGHVRLRFSVQPYGIQFCIIQLITGCLSSTHFALEIRTENI